MDEITDELGLSEWRRKQFTEATKSFLIRRVKPSASSSRDLPDDLRHSLSRDFLSLHGSEYFNDEDGTHYQHDTDAGQLLKLIGQILARQWNNQVDHCRKQAARRSAGTTDVVDSTDNVRSSRKRRRSIDGKFQQDFHIVHETYLLLKMIRLWRWYPLLSNVLRPDLQTQPQIYLPQPCSITMVQMPPTT